MTEKRFPVLDQQSGPRRLWTTVPRDVPWAFAETFRTQAEYNHGQTLERLAERGGLDPAEMYLAAHGRNLRVLPDKQEAIDWLYTASGEPR